MRGRLLVQALAALVVLALGCRVEKNLHRPTGWKAPPPELETKRKVDKETGRVIREWSMLVYADRPPVKHGKETVWSASGVKLSEREYDEGKPFGAWRGWYSDGTPQSESFFGALDVDTQMTFWHPNGQMSMRGPARNGSRRGQWTVWYANGQIAEQGEFVASMREGRWIAWSKDGTQRFERVYRKNVRKSDTPLTDEPEPVADTVVPVEEDERPLK